MLPNTRCILWGSDVIILLDAFLGFGYFTGAHHRPSKPAPLGQNFTKVNVGCITERSPLLDRGQVVCGPRLQYELPGDVESVDRLKSLRLSVRNPPRHAKTQRMRSGDQSLQEASAIVFANAPHNPRCPRYNLCTTHWIL